MSFEGYYQILCTHGHYTEIDVYDFSERNYKCLICSAIIGWKNLVDQTNATDTGKVNLEKTNTHDLTSCAYCAGRGYNNRYRKPRE